jgi:eukaryotic-like serine/threonine-protein kinase
VAVNDDDEASSSTGDGVAEDTEIGGSAGSSISAGRPAPLTRGATVGRYIVVELVGAGGMGEVYGAFDPQLDRRIALKILRVAGPDSVDGARVLREARALARLSHPNVVAVFDAGTADEAVYIAMELVDGVTLTKWLRERREWHEVLAIFLQAGRGLAAAHSTGLVHRDFKPDNAMVGVDGRVRVMDFGLARVAVGRESAEPVATTGSATALPLDLTATGTLVGTPAYVAPEVYAGASADERADQFSFCVALWGALFRMRPFGGDVAYEIAAAAARGDIRPPPASSAVPGWLRAVVERGLAAKPEARWPDLHALLAALERDPSRQRRWAVGIGLLGLVGVGGIVASSAAERGREAACALEGRTIDEVWNEGAALEMREHFVATGLAFAEPTYDRSRARLDDYAATWAEARRDACMISREDPARAAARSSCLLFRRAALAKTVDVLVAAEKRDVIAAIGATSRLRPIAECDDGAQAEDSEIDPAARTAFEQHRAEADALLDLGRYDEGVVAAQAALAAAESIDAARLVAAARADLGEGLFLEGELDRARAELETAYFSASGLGDDRTAARAATRLLTLVGEQLGRMDEGLHWGRLAAAAIERQTGDTTLARAHLLSSRARVHLLAADFDAATAEAIESLALVESVYGEDHPDVASAVNTVGTVYMQQGDDEKAAAAFERARALAETAYGESHVEVARYLHNAAGVEYNRGDLAKARALSERSLAIKEQWLDPNSREIASSLNALGNLAMRDANYAEAQRLLERTVAIFRKLHDGDHPALLAVIANLAHAHHVQEHYGEAEVLYRECLAMAERLFGVDGLQVADVLSDLAASLADDGRLDEALLLGQRAVAIHDAKGPPDHPQWMEAMVTQSEHLVKAGREREALPLLERLLSSIDAKPQTDPIFRGRARYWLARTVWTLDRDAARARKLAEGARTDLANAGAAAAPEVEALTQWSATLPAATK